MDDMIILREDKTYLNYALSRLSAELGSKLKLEFNEKTQIIPIKNGVQFLGYHFYLSDTGKVMMKVRQSSKRRFKRRLKLFQKQFHAGEVTLEDIHRSLPGYYGHFKRGHTYRMVRHALRSFTLQWPDTT